MYLLYLDASGAPELTDHTRHYVLIGLCVHEGTWFALNKRILGLKKRYAYPGEDFELHVKDFNCTIDGQDKIPNFVELSPTERRAAVVSVQQAKISDLASSGNAKKAAELRFKYHRQRAFVHLTRQQRTNLYEDALDLIGDHRGIVLFGEAVSKKHPIIASGKSVPTAQGFEQVITRFDAYLERRQRWNKLSKPRSRIETGLLVMDHDYASERNIEKQFTDFRQRGHQWGQLRHVIEAPFFVSSSKLPGIQIVDVCAYALRRYLDQGAVAESHEERQLAKIIGLFDRNQGRLHGLRHFVPPGSCSCMICAERGHSLDSDL